jgi:UDP-glucose:(heptosyl)LPS alpha-1,3-glucosyltransferase
MAAGLPVVTTRWNGAAELIEQGVSGLVLDDPLDAAALAGAIVALAPEPARIAAGRAAAAAVAGRSTARNVTETLAVVAEVMNAR